MRMQKILMSQTPFFEKLWPDGFTDQEFDQFLESLTQEETRQLLDKMMTEIDRLMDNAYRDRYAAWLREDGWPEETIPSAVERPMAELYRSLTYDEVNFKEITRYVSRNYR
jgi:hypothetical protein